MLTLDSLGCLIAYYLLQEYVWMNGPMTEVNLNRDCFVNHVLGISTIKDCHVQATCIVEKTFKDGVVCVMLLIMDTSKLCRIEIEPR